MYKVIGGDRQEYGPVTAEEIGQWIAEGRLSGQSLAQEEGYAEWKSLTNFPEFSEQLRAQAARVAAGASIAAMSSPELLRAGLRQSSGRIEVAYCLSRSGQLLANNLGLLVGTAMLAWFLGLVCQLIPLIGGMLYLFLHGVFYGGMYLVFLRRIRGQPAAVGDVLAAFSLAFGPLALAGFLSSLLSSIGFIFCFLPGLYLLVAWAFAVPLVADKKLEAWSAMELSRRTVTRSWGQIAVLLLLAFLPVVVMYLYAQVKIFSVSYPGFREVMSSGTMDLQRFKDLFVEIAKVSVPLAILNKIILLFNLPFATGALLYAYEDLFGAQKSGQP